MSNIGILKQNGVHLREHEYSTVKLLLESGYDVELVPPSQIKGLHLPDIIMQGVPWEIKAPLGNGKHTIKHNIQNAAPQSNNVIIDLRRCNLSEESAMKDLERQFKLSHRIKQMKVIVTDEKIIDFRK